jgi:hypothetical protein
LISTNIYYIRRFKIKTAKNRDKFVQQQICFVLVMRQWSNSIGPTRYRLHLAHFYWTWHLHSIPRHASPLSLTMKQPPKDITVIFHKQISTAFIQFNKNVTISFNPSKAKQLLQRAQPSFSLETTVFVSSILFHAFSKNNRNRRRERETWDYFPTGILNFRFFLRF